MVAIGTSFWAAVELFFRARLINGDAAIGKSREDDGIVSWRVSDGNAIGARAMVFLVAIEHESVMLFVAALEAPEHGPRAIFVRASVGVKDALDDVDDAHVRRSGWSLVFWDNAGGRDAGMWAGDDIGARPFGLMRVVVLADRHAATVSGLALVAVGADD